MSGKRRQIHRREKEREEMKEGGELEVYTDLLVSLCFNGAGIHHKARVEPHKIEQRLQQQET